MAIGTFAFDPATGFKDATEFPDPANETAAREQVQSLLDQIKTYVNEEIKDVLNSTTDSSSGGDNLAMTAIAALGAQTTAQSIIEALVALLNGAGGATWVKSAGVAGLVGDNVQALLSALKVYVDAGDSTQSGALAVHKSSSDHDSRYYTETEIDGKVTTLNNTDTTNANNLTTHKSSADHDSRYFTETELAATTGAGLVGATAPSGLTGSTIQTLINALKALIDLNDSNITANRKLSASGNFTGTLNGAPITSTDPGLSSIVNAMIAENQTQTATLQHGQNIINADRATPFNAMITGNTLINLAGWAGRTGTSTTVSNLDSTKYYVVMNDASANVTVDGISQVTPHKFTGKTSTALSWASGYVAVYEISSDTVATLTTHPYVDAYQTLQNPYLMATPETGNPSYQYFTCKLAEGETLEEIDGVWQYDKLVEKDEPLTITSNVATLTKDATASSTNIVDTTTGDVFHLVTTLSGSGNEFTQSGTGYKTITFNASANPTTPLAYYTLATPTTEIVQPEGSLMLNGPTQVELGEGIVVRESVVPTTVDNTYYNINIYGFPSIPNSTLKNRLNKVIQIYKNNDIDTQNWLATSDAYSYGNFRYYCSLANGYDPTASYSVTYQVLDKYLFTTNSPAQTGTYSTNDHTVLQNVVSNLEDDETRISIVERNYAKKLHGQILVPTLLNGWVNFGGVYITAGYYKDEFGLVHPEGLIKLGAITQTTKIFNFTTGHRPRSQIVCAALCFNGSTAQICSLEISPTGDLTTGVNVANTWLDLSSIVPFRAEQ